MSFSPGRITRVLAVQPTTRGFGFAVMERPDGLIDWGTKEARGDKNKQALIHLAALIGRYQPEVLVFEDTETKDSRRCARIRLLAQEIAQMAIKLRVRTRRIPRRLVKHAFAETGPTTKPWIAAAIASQFPELSRHLPARRRPWMSQDVRMSIFDAVALALTHYGRIEVRES